MHYSLNYIELENFKSYSDVQRISLSDLSILLGANSSGKSTALQALLVLKQTLECNSHDIELLLSGKYVALGEFEDVINNFDKKYFGINLGFKLDGSDLEAVQSYVIKWRFSKKTDTSFTELNQVDICFDNCVIGLVRTKSHYYSLFKNQELLPVYVAFKDLHLSEMIIRYDKKLNLLFAEFLNSMKKAFLGEKTTTFSPEKYITYGNIYKFFVELLHNSQLNDNFGYQVSPSDQEIGNLSDKLSDLVDDILTQHCPLVSDYERMEKELTSNILYNVIRNSGKKQLLNEILNKYSIEFSDYLASFDDNSSSNFDGEDLCDSFSFRTTVKSSEFDLNSVVWYLRTLYYDFERNLRKLFFLGPIRENPKGLYNIGFEQDPKYVGPTGSNFASVLLHENREKQYILPSGIEQTSLCEALNEWALHLNIASAVEVHPATSFGIKVSVSDTQNNTADIMNVGIGTSQVLPVLISGLLSEENEILIYEQPELHLHPYAQGRLADFFVSLARNKRTIVIETHSEAIILRLRYHILKGSFEKDSVAVNFFHNCNGTKVTVCNISGFGIIEYPDDFKDETQELLNDLLLAAINKNNG